jgi:hypothetical protein
MSAFPGGEQPLQRDPDELLRDGRLGLVARIEGLVGEEHALLRIPAGERSQAQHDRLHAIGTELDRVFDKLRERAERLAGHRPAGDQR